MSLASGLVFLVSSTVAERATCGQDATAAVVSGTPRATYEDSVLGLQSQMDELIRQIRGPEEKAFLAELDTLAIPNSREWLGAHFPAYAVGQLQNDYEKAFAGYRSHVWWVMGNFGKDAAFRVRVEASELPKPVAEVGFEALLPRPDASMKVENYRISPLSSKPPSWVSSFVYVDGRFRFVGGTFPFWNERLTPLRGPMAIPVKTIGDLAVQGVPIEEVDPKTPGVVAIVVMDINIGGDGRVHKCKVKSGEPPYVKQAEDYVRDWKFYPLPTTYRMNVVFFKTKSSQP